MQKERINSNSNLTGSLVKYEAGVVFPSHSEMKAVVGRIKVLLIINLWSTFFRVYM